ncbi:MAG: hypothetical protein ACI9W2_000973 [Gammaproteobacteria bacterium]|jgi:hypothetical protein
MDLPTGKISATLLEFGEPLLDFYDDASVEEFHAALTIVITVCNAHGLSMVAAEITASIFRNLPAFGESSHTRVRRHRCSKPSTRLTPARWRSTATSLAASVNGICCPTVWVATNFGATRDLQVRDYALMRRRMKFPLPHFVGCRAPSGRSVPCATRVRGTNGIEMC